MQQLFSTRNYSVRDFEEWDERKELVLAPKFQRRDVWNPRAKSYLIDTIVRGKPIPKLYMRQSVVPKGRRTTREIVDGQQRLRAVLSFIKDGFKISRAHHKEFGGLTFSELDTATQKDILKYEFVVDLLQDMPDREVYDLFARINTFSERLKPQELRNAKFFGDFKSCVYELAITFNEFVEAYSVFTPKQVLRMAEAEFISELLLAMQEGPREGKKSVIDKAYSDYDDTFPNRERHEKRFVEVVDTIGTIGGAELTTLRFRSAKLLYPLFCAVYHMKFAMPRVQAPRQALKATDYPKLKAVLEELNDLIEEVEDGTRKPTDEQRKFYEAQDTHWVHTSSRLSLTQYLCRKFVAALS
ncbi:MAG: DUF262 domain-containing protein [Vicinamibacterales bacterium]